jgi:hypothetical protein
MRIVLRMSEWQHREGTRYGGRYIMGFSMPRQSKTILTLPDKLLCNLFSLNKIRWIAIRPRSSPLYAFATDSISENDPTMHPHPLEHSITNAAEHRLGYIFRMYDPSVTATSKPLVIDSCIQVTPPETCRCSQSQVFPHDCRMSRKEVGIWSCLARGSDDVRCQFSPPNVGSTEQTVFRLLWSWQCE